MAGNAYTVMLTSDSSLVVNDTPLTPEGVPPGDGQSLLGWALDSINGIHQKSGEELTLTLRDHRDRGYGTQMMTFAPGETITIEGLAPTEPERNPESTNGVKSTGATAVEKPSTPMSPETSTLDQVSGRATSGTSHSVGQPAQAMPAARGSAAVTADRTSSAERPSPSGHRASAPPAAPSASGATKAVPVSETRRGRGRGRGKGSIPLARDETQAERYGWNRITLPVPRPSVADETVRQRAKRSRLMLVVLGVFVVLGALLVRGILVGDPGATYVAICTDERTLTRQPSTQNCEDTQAPTYYRWFYVAEEGQVPAVGGLLRTGDGSLIMPDDEDATVLYDFAEDGGTVVGQD